MMEMKEAGTFFHGNTGILEGKGVEHAEKHLKGVADIFRDSEAASQMDSEILVYEVDAHQVAGGVTGGLYFGVSRIHPGKVNGEYFMTRGHFHNIGDRAEYYWGISGRGLLLLMDKDRKVTIEKVSPGSLHYIPGWIAHRLVNTGDTVLTVGACWPSDAGHDYGSIKTEGFSVRVFDRDGEAVAQDC